MKNKTLNGKQLFMLAILVVGLAIVVIQVGRKQLLERQAAGGAATIILTPSTNSPVTVANGGNFNVLVSLNPNGETLVGADVLLTFNKAILAVNTIQVPTFISGQNLQTYAPTTSNGSFNTTNVISTANSTGTLSMGAVAFNWASNAVLPAQSVAASFATINFKAIATGTTEIKVGFTSGSTTDSNLVSITSGSPADVISDSTATALASKLPVTVNSGTTPTVPPPSNTPTKTPTPIVPTITPTKTPTPIVPTITPTKTPTPIVPTITPTKTPTPIVPTITPTKTPTPTNAPTMGSLNFSIKFQGINTAKPNKLVRVILRQGANTIYTFNNINVAANASGVYSGTIANINPGNYDVLIKGPVHLQKKMTASPIAISTSGSVQDWTSTILKAGDVFGPNGLPDNTIQINDVSGIIGVWSESDTAVTTANQKYDLDDNGFIQISDVSAVIGNWSESVTSGDN